MVLVNTVKAPDEKTQVLSCGNLNSKSTNLFQLFAFPSLAFNYL